MTLKFITALSYAQGLLELGENGVFKALDGG